MYEKYLKNIFIEDSAFSTPDMWSPAEAVIIE